MASILKVDKLDPQSGTALELGTSGDTISVPSGATLDISASTLTPPATMPASSGINLTALNATNLGSGTVPTARLGTGTASSSTILYGDQTYKAEPSGGANTPYFLAYCSGNQTGIADNATVDVEFDSEIYDSAGEFDTTTYKWTPTTAGYYWIEAQVYFSSSGDLNEARVYLDVSGTLKFYTPFSNYDAPFNYGSFSAGGIYYLSGSNYVDVRAGADTNGTTWTRGGSGTTYMTSFFQGWKLIT